MNINSLKKPWLNAAMFLLAITSLSSCLKDTALFRILAKVLHWWVFNTPDPDHRI